MGQWLFALAFLFIFQNATAINHQEEIRKAQDWADSFNTPYPVVIFDRDEMTFLLAQHGLLGKEKSESRFEFLVKYIDEKFGVLLDRNEAEILDNYLSTQTSSAVAQPLLERYGYSADYKMCAVFANPPNGNARIESERMMSLGFSDVYADQTYDKLAKKMSFEELYLFSLYHEVGHCLDTEFMPAIYEKGEDAYYIHLSEAFAETMAYLSLVDRLGPKVAEARALYRTVYSRKMGEFFGKEEGGSFNPHRKMGGVIYHLTPYLLKSYEQIKFKNIEIDLNDPSGLLETAITLVKSNRLEAREFSAIGMGLTQGFDSALKNYEGLAFDSPDFFYETYLGLIEYKNLTDLWLKKAFIVPNEVLPIPPAGVPSLQMGEFCDAVENGDIGKFYEVLTKSRVPLQSVDYSPHTLQARYDELNKLPHLLESCPRTRSH